MLEVNSGQAYLRKVRLAVPGGDSLRLQLQLGRSLQVVNLRPPGLSEAAVLLVRRLVTPSLNINRLDEIGYSQALERALISRLEACVHDAYHPARGAVPAQASAVIFSDWAELLACLGRDWLNGSLTERWWWRSFSLKMLDGETVLSAWTKHIEYLPGAFGLLAQWGIATRLVRALEPTTVNRWINLVIRQFGLYELNAILTGPPDQLDRKTLAENRHATAEAPYLPWQWSIPEILAPGLTPEGRQLIGVGLGLHRTPQLVRTVLFATALAELSYQSDSSGLTPPQAEPDVSTLLGTPPKTGQELSQAAFDSPAREIANPDGDLDQTERSGLIDRDMNSGPDLGTRIRPPFLPSNVQTSGAEAPIRENRARATPGTPRRSLEMNGMDANGTRELGKSTKDFPHSAPRSASLDEMLHGDNRQDSTLQVESSPRTDSIPGVALGVESFETRLGGLFYLINLALYLELYGDFTTPLQPGIFLSVWDFITLVGKRLLGGCEESDPVWVILERLAGRAAGEPAGKDFDPPLFWRLPPAWLQPFPEEPWVWFVQEDRLEIHHPAGFRVIDVPLDPFEVDLDERVRQELAPYKSCLSMDVVSRITPAPAVHLEYHSGLAFWIDRFSQYAGARLCRALGLDSVHDLPACLCLHPARIDLTSTHLDVTFSLAEHPVAIRMAGLDRNPGWLPAAGRYITFHYE